MKQPNGPDGGHVRERKLAPRHAFDELQRVSEMRRPCEMQPVARQLLRSAAIEGACSMDQRRSSHPRATNPCAA
jgi:hypothetical protein